MKTTAITKTFACLCGLAAAASLLLVAWMFPPRLLNWGAGGYQSLHTAMEIFSIVVSVLGFAVVWGAPPEARCNNMIAVGCAFLGVAILDTGHALSFLGMPDWITPNHPSKPIAFWFAARFLALAGLLALCLQVGADAAPWKRRYSLPVVLAYCGVAYFVILAHPALLPEFFVPGHGLTTTKVAIEWVLVAGYLLAAILLWRRRRDADNYDALLAATAAALMALSEVCFSLYTLTTDAYNLLGHIYKIAAFFLIYDAIYLRTQREPYRILRENEERFRSLAALSADWYWRKDESFRLIELSSTYEKRSGFSRADDLGKANWDLPGVDRGYSDWDAHRRDLQHRRPFRNFISRRRNAAGEWTYCNTSGDPVFDQAGIFTGYRGTSRNVSRYFTARETSESNRQRFESIVSTAMDAVVTINEAHKITLFNQSAETIFGYAAHEVLGRNVDMLLPPDMRERHARSIDEFSASRSMMTQPARVVFGLRKDGSRFPLEASVSLLETGEGRMLTAILRDITGRVEQEQRLIALNESLESRVKTRTEELQRANLELEAFSHSVSHDLRAPLRAVEGFTGLLRDSLGADLSPDTRRYMDNISRNVDKMGRLIDDVLRYARVTRSEFQAKTVNLDREVAEVVADLRGQYPQTRFDVGELGEVKGDASMLRQVFANLVENACKYSAGEDVPVVAIGRGGQGTSREYYVRDNGIGFDMKYAGKLFGMFQRMHAETSIPGTGVGLAIVKRLVERHGGSITAQSAPNAGTCFTFTLGPAEPA